MIKQKLVLFAACAAIVLVLSGLRAQAQTLYDPNEPGSFLVFPKFVRGTVASGLPATEIEVTVHCPLDQQPCAVPGTNIRLQGQWVCPGSYSNFKCSENNFIFQTTEEGTVNFSTETANITNGGFTYKIPAPLCPEGFLVVYAVNNKNEPIVFNGLLGDAEIRWNGHSEGSYNAVAIQAIGTSNTVITSAKVPSFPFDGFSGHYASLAGTVMSTIKYPQTTATSTTTPDSPSETTLSLLTLDTLSNRLNFDTFVDMDFYDANENVSSENTDFICFEDVPVDYIDSGLTTPFWTRKGFFVSLDANKVQEYGFADTAGPVTLIGLVDTVECEQQASCSAPETVDASGSTGTAVGPGSNPTVLNHYMLKDDDDSIPVATAFVGL